MYIYAATAITAILAIAVVHVVYSRIYHASFRNADQVLLNRVESTERSSPKVALILCLRGFDPTLQRCLDGISIQSYDNFDLHIVIDDPDDEGGNFARDYFAGKSDWQPVFHHFDTSFEFGSLKCRALVHTIGKIIDDYPFLALIDADTAPDQYWLHDLIEPMIEDDSISATTGNRWFQPSADNLGSILRKVWNAAAVIQMYLFNIAWGGSLAIRRDAFVDANLLEKWESAFCEDTMLHDVLRANHLKLVRIPHLIIENDENISMAAQFSWVSRQLLNARLYHRAWWLIFGHAILLIIGLTATIGLFMLLLLQRDWVPASLLFASFCVLQLVNYLLIRWVEIDNVRILRTRGSLDYVARRSSSMKTLVAVVLNQLMQPFGVLRAHFRRTVSWRGIKYRVKNNRPVQIIRYRPYSAIVSETTTPSATKSIN